MGIDGFGGVTASDTSAAGATVKVVAPVTAPTLALIWALPCAAPLASPAAVIVAAALDDAQVAEPLRFWVVPSE